MKTHDEVAQIKTEAEADLIKKPGVTGMDVGQRLADGKPTGEFIIRIYVTNKTRVLKRLKLPSEIRGVQVEVVERRFSLH